MPTEAQLSAWDIEDANHIKAVHIFYATGNENVLGPVLADVCRRLPLFLRKKRAISQELLNDVVQDSLEEILLGLRKQGYVSTGKLMSWAMAICWNVYLDHLGRYKDKPSEPGPHEDPFLLVIERSADSADELVVANEEEARATALIKGATRVVLGLDINARNALLAYFYHGHSSQEAAAHLGISVGKFIGRYKRGIAALRECGAQQQAPTAELYKALSRIDTGDLFRDPPQRLSWRAKQAARKAAEE